MVRITARVCCEHQEQHRLCWPTCTANRGGLELQDALTTSLQGTDLGFDSGEGLRQVLLQESLDWLTRRLPRALDERLNLFEGQPQGAQALDHLHTSEGFFPKEAVVALATAPRGKEAEALVGAQHFDGYTRAPGKVSNSHRMRLYHISLPFMLDPEGLSIARIAERHRTANDREAYGFHLRQLFQQDVQWTGFPWALLL